MQCLYNLSFVGLPRLQSRPNYKRASRFLSIPFSLCSSSSSLLQTAQAPSTCSILSMQPTQTTINSPDFISETTLTHKPRVLIELYAQVMVVSAFVIAFHNWSTFFFFPFSTGTLILANLRSDLFSSRVQNPVLKFVSCFIPISLSSAPFFIFLLFFLFMFSINDKDHHQPSGNKSCAKRDRMQKFKTRISNELKQRFWTMALDESDSPQLWHMYSGVHFVSHRN